MRKLFIRRVILLIAFWPAAMLAEENTPQGFALRVELRTNGSHALYLLCTDAGVGCNGSEVNPAFTNQACDLDDRAIITQTNDIERVMVDAYIRAVAEKQRVQLRVDGCVSIGTSSGLTAPNVIKIKIYSD